MVAPNKSLREKSTARLMAVQLAYSHQLLHKTPNAAMMMRDGESFKADDDQAEFPAVFKDKAHRPTLERLLDGYCEHKEVLAAIALESLHDDWQPGRVNPLLLVILELGILELDHHRELASAIIVDEYTGIAARLLDVTDIDFLHACLKKLADKLRN